MFSSVNQYHFHTELIFFLPFFQSTLTRVSRLSHLASHIELVLIFALLLAEAELKSFLQFHNTGEEPLRDDEILILNGVLSLNQTSAGDSE